MLKLERRGVDAFLPEPHQTALSEREKAATQCAIDTTKRRSQRIRDAWDNFRQGKTAKGTCDLLLEELLTMSFRKCAFCEAPQPKTIEHIEEKAKVPAKMFSWPNLLPACSVCNTGRQNSGIAAQPIDPSSCEPLDYLGWDLGTGWIIPNPQHKARVEAHVEMYSLRRYDGARKRCLVGFKAHLFALTLQESPDPRTKSAIETDLKPEAQHMGPIREYLLRPPTEDDKWLLDEALRRLPEIRDWVKPWLRAGPMGGVRWASESG